MSTLFIFDQFILYAYVRLYMQKWKTFVQLLFILIAVIVLFESAISIQQFIASSPIGKNIESQVGIEYFGQAVDEIEYRFRPVGTFEHANELGQVLSFFLLVIIARVYSRGSFGFLVVVFAGLITLVTTLSRSAWIAFALCLVIELYIAEKIFRLSHVVVPRWLILTSSGVFIILLSYFILPRMERSLYSFGIDAGGGYTRNLQIKNALTLILIHPFFGVGSLMSVSEGLAIDPSGVLASFPSPVHNWYFLTAVEHGLPALFLFLFFVILLLRRTYHTTVESGRKSAGRILLVGFFVGVLALLIIGLFQPFINDRLIFLSLAVMQSLHSG